MDKSSGSSPGASMMLKRGLQARNDSLLLLVAATISANSWIAHDVTIFSNATAVFPLDRSLIWVHWAIENRYCSIS